MVPRRHGKLFPLCTQFGDEFVGQDVVGAQGQKQLPATAGCSEMAMLV